jgi:hypothetical protein
MIINALYSQCEPGNPRPTKVAPAAPTATAGVAAKSLNSKLVTHGKRFWGAIADPVNVNQTNDRDILLTHFGGITSKVRLQRLMYM